jgi:predicted nucleic acid-binding protein
LRLLDTDILIDIQRGHPPAVTWFTGLTERPAVPLLVVMELLQDAANKTQVTAALRLVGPLTVVYTAPADQQRALLEHPAPDHRADHPERLHPGPGDAGDRGGAE